MPERSGGSCDACRSQDGRRALEDRAKDSGPPGRCPSCGEALPHRPAPRPRLTWKSFDAADAVYERFRAGPLETVPLDGADGRIRFLVRMMERALKLEVLRATRNPEEGVLALYLRRDEGRLDEIVLLREPLRRPDDYGSDPALSVCWALAAPTAEEGRSKSAASALSLYRRWRRGPFEEVDLAGGSGLCRLVREAAGKFEEKLYVRVVAAYRTPPERIIALLSFNALQEWDKAGFVEEFRMRELVPFRIPHLTVGGRHVSREDFPQLG